MPRLPDWLYRRLERVYFDERRRRRELDRQELARQDAAQRAFYAGLGAAHDSGMCGGYEGGCRYFPCYAVGDRVAEQQKVLRDRAANTAGS